ncbi:large ribosomal subunit protein bL28m [Planococcus citri]|uniref:large ribosomal subunit protein bL28m n=1 Tax=Planococcus citri TaxID=170843 RepID=UPI0031F91A0E
MLLPNIYPYNLTKYTRPAKNIFFKQIYKNLPEEYRKFYLEWKDQIPKPVHYIPKEGMYEKDPNTGEVKLVQNFAIPLSDSPQMDDGIWGGESIIQGFRRTYHPKFRKIDLGPAPKFWLPNLHRGVVYSEVLDKHVACILTHRAINLINEHFGLDHYLIQTPACDLRNLLAIKLKRKILLALRDETLYPEDEDKRQEILDEYKPYLDKFTHEEIEWYGLTLEEATKKLRFAQIQSQEKPVPLKQIYRKEFLEFLKENEMEPAKGQPWWKMKLISYK